MAGSRISAVDIHVGRRVKMARLAAGISQEKLAGALGISFQQIQKYENGTNRVGPGRLHAVAKLLNLPVPFFFEGADKTRHGGRDVVSAAESALATKEGVRIAIALSRIHSSELRRRVATLLEQMIDGKQGAESVRRM